MLTPIKKALWHVGPALPSLPLPPTPDLESEQTIDPGSSCYRGLAPAESSASSGPAHHSTTHLLHMP